MTLRRALALTAIFAALALLIGGAYALTRPQRPPEIQAELGMYEVLGGDDTSGFARATGPRDFSFPADHGPHPDYAVEWWYYTGNLGTPKGRHFGFELTFFRIGLTPEPPQRESDWAASHLFMAHFALTDVQSEEFHYFQRFSREAMGLAGARAEPFRVWLEDWYTEGTADSALPMHLHAAQDGVSIDLILEGGKPIVLQGDDGLSQKSAEPGNASYYYSMTRMPASGQVRVDGQSFQVSGAAWMDREWSTSALSEDQDGWDWFALQLSDGRELMFYQLRLRGGGADPLSSGVLVLADGSTRRLTRDQVQIEVLDRWQSSRGGDPYPSRWRIRVPSESLDVEVVPYIPDQELALSVRYWEGAVKIRGTADGAPITGSGYVEMTGYGSGTDRRS